jgi:hypothetical protein
VSVISGVRNLTVVCAGVQLIGFHFQHDGVTLVNVVGGI